MRKFCQRSAEMRAISRLALAWASAASAWLSSWSSSGVSIVASILPLGHARADVREPMLEVAVDPRVNGGLLKRRDVARQFELDLRRRSRGMDDTHGGNQVLERVALQLRAGAGAGHNRDAGQNSQHHSNAPQQEQRDRRGYGRSLGDERPQFGPMWRGGRGRGDAGFCFRLLHKF